MVNKIPVSFGVLIMAISIITSLMIIHPQVLIIEIIICLFLIRMYRGQHNMANEILRNPVDLVIRNDLNKYMQSCRILTLALILIIISDLIVLLFALL